MTIKLNKPATIKPATSAQRGAELAKVIKSGDTIGQSMDSICQAEHKARKGKNVGTVKSGDEFMIALNKGLIDLGYTGSTLANKLTAVRKAVNEGGSFQHKPYAVAKPKGAKPAQGKGNQAKAEKTGIVITLTGEPKAEEVSSVFRKFLNKIKANDKYSELASFMLDGLDEFDGE
jgi:hypothetical protein